MPSIVIHHCKLRVVRRGGWAWGPEPQRLLQSAVRNLPDLLARRLAGLWEDGSEREIVAPVRITIPVRMSELMTLSIESDDHDLPAEASLSAGLSARLAQAMRTTFMRDHSVPGKTWSPPQHRPGTVQITGVDVSPGMPMRTTFTRDYLIDRPGETWSTPQDRPGTLQIAGVDVSPEKLWSGSLLRLLLSWQQQGVLETRLELFSLPSLEAWHHTVFHMQNDPQTGGVEVEPEIIDQLLRELVVVPTRAALNRVAILRLRILSILELVGQLNMTPGNTVIQQAVDRVLPLPVVALADETAPSVAVQGKKQTGVPTILSSTTQNKPLQTSSPHGQASPRLAPEMLYEGEFTVSSALPFLLLGPLAHLGYLETLTATLEAVELLPRASLFATALAYKVLDPPKRGWRRDPATVATAAAFAGLAEPVTEPALAEFSRQITEHLSPLNAVLSSALIEGHDSQKPLLLYHTDSPTGLLLVDTEGLFPIAWADELEGLFPTLVRCDTSALLIPQTTAAPELLGRLHSAGFHFITDAPPTRHEHWRCLRLSPLGRWWTNDESTHESQLLKAAQCLEDAAEETATLWRVLAIERPSVPTTPGTALEYSLTLAAAVALGTIAWTLWRERESVVPYLALDRFRDLDARVRFSREAVRVRLPLGQRYRDLHEHGLLDDVNGIPWLAGRVLQFSGG